MLVSREEFEALIEELRADPRDPALGIFGPGSAMWRMAADPVVFLGAGRAALLQLAHPYVASAIEQHSRTRRDPLGRFHRTFQALFGMIFADRPAALAAALRVRRVHERVTGEVDADLGRFPRGHRYHANDVAALCWVGATLAETTVLVWELVHGPLPPADKEAYYRDYVRLLALFGLSPAALPPTWGAFATQCAAVADGPDLAVGPYAREMAAFLMRPGSRAAAPLGRWNRALTAGLLPPRIRAQYGLSFGPLEQALFRASVRALRAGWSKLPARARERPEYREALARIAGKPRIDRVGRWGEQAVLAVMAPRG
jgi:uncharacterized protein (DUF2236 family)